MEADIPSIPESPDPTPASAPLLQPILRLPSESSLDRPSRVADHHDSSDVTTATAAAPAASGPVMPADRKEPPDDAHGISHIDDDDDDDDDEAPPAVSPYDDYDPGAHMHFSAIPHAHLRRAFADPEPNRLSLIAPFLPPDDVERLEAQRETAPSRPHGSTAALPSSHGRRRVSGQRFHGAGEGAAAATDNAATATDLKPGRGPGKRPSLSRRTPIAAAGRAAPLTNVKRGNALRRSCSAILLLNDSARRSPLNTGVPTMVAAGDRGNGGDRRDRGAGGRVPHGQTSLKHRTRSMDALGSGHALTPPAAHPPLPTVAADGSPACGKRRASMPKKRSLMRFFKTQPASDDEVFSVTSSSLASPSGESDTPGSRAMVAPADNLHMSSMTTTPARRRSHRAPAGKTGTEGASATIRGMTPIHVLNENGFEPAVDAISPWGAEPPTDAQLLRSKSMSLLPSWVAADSPPWVAPPGDPMSDLFRIGGDQMMTGAPPGAHPDSRSGGGATWFSRLGHALSRTRTTLPALDHAEQVQQTVAVSVWSTGGALHVVHVDKRMSGKTMYQKILDAATPPQALRARRVALVAWDELSLGAIGGFPSYENPIMSAASAATNQPPPPSPLSVKAVRGLVRSARPSEPLFFSVADMPSAAPQRTARKQRPCGAVSSATTTSLATTGSIAKSVDLPSKTAPAVGPSPRAGVDSAVNVAASTLTRMTHLVAAPAPASSPVTAAGTPSRRGRHILMMKRRRRRRQASGSERPGRLAIAKQLDLYFPGIETVTVMPLQRVAESPSPAGTGDPSAATSEMAFETESDDAAAGIPRRAGRGWRPVSAPPAADRHPSLSPPPRYDGPMSARIQWPGCDQDDGVVGDDEDNITFYPGIAVYRYRGGNTISERGLVPPRPTFGDAVVTVVTQPRLTAAARRIQGSAGTPSHSTHGLSTQVPSRIWNGALAKKQDAVHCPTSAMPIPMPSSMPTTPTLRGLGMGSWIGAWLGHPSHSGHHHLDGRAHGGGTSRGGMSRDGGDDRARDGTSTGTPGSAGSANGRSNGAWTPVHGVAPSPRPGPRSLSRPISPASPYPTVRPGEPANAEPHVALADLVRFAFEDVSAASPSAPGYPGGEASNAAVDGGPPHFASLPRDRGPKPSFLARCFTLTSLSAGGSASASSRPPSVPSTQSSRHELQDTFAAAIKLPEFKLKLPSRRNSALRSRSSEQEAAPHSDAAFMSPATPATPAPALVPPATVAGAALMCSSLKAPLSAGTLPRVAEAPMVMALQPLLGPASPTARSDGAAPLSAGAAAAANPLTAIPAHLLKRGAAGGSAGSPPAGRSKPALARLQTGLSRHFTPQGTDSASAASSKTHALEVAAAGTEAASVPLAPHSAWVSQNPNASGLGSLFVSPRPQTADGVSTPLAAARLRGPRTPHVHRHALHAPPPRPFSLAVTDAPGGGDDAADGRLPSPQAQAHGPHHRPPLWYQGDCIGRGAFARVYLGLDLENWDLIAVKQVRHSAMARANAATTTTAIATGAHVGAQGAETPPAALATSGIAAQASPRLGAPGAPGAASRPRPISRAASVSRRPVTPAAGAGTRPSSAASSPRRRSGAPRSATALATSTTTCGWCACDLRDISHSTLRTEIGLLLSLSHPHIVRCFGYQVTAEQTSIFMEYVPGGSVASVLARLGPFPLAVAKDVTAQLLDALAYLHARGVVHRDVKAANVLLDINGTVKLSDFGESRRLRVLPLSSSAASAASSPPGSAVPPLSAVPPRSAVALDTLSPTPREPAYTLGPSQPGTPHTPRTTRAPAAAIRYERRSSIHGTAFWMAPEMVIMRGALRFKTAGQDGVPGSAGELSTGYAAAPALAAVPAAGSRPAPMATPPPSFPVAATTARPPGTALHASASTPQLSHAASRPLTTTAPSVIGYDFGVDVWGVGCVLLEMMSAQRPWPSCSTEMQAFYQLGLGRVPPLPRTPQADPAAQTGAAPLAAPPYHASSGGSATATGFCCAPDERDTLRFLARVMSPNPATRPSAQVMRDDPWFATRCAIAAPTETVDANPAVGGTTTTTATSESAFAQWYRTRSAAQQSERERGNGRVSNDDDDEDDEDDNDDDYDVDDLDLDFDELDDETSQASWEVEGRGGDRDAWLVSDDAYDEDDEAYNEEADEVALNASVGVADGPPLGHDDARPLFMPLSERVAPDATHA